MDANTGALTADGPARQPGSMSDRRRSNFARFNEGSHLTYPRTGQLTGSYRIMVEHYDLQLASARGNDRIITCLAEALPAWAGRHGIGSHNGTNRTEDAVVSGSRIRAREDCSGGPRHTVLGAASSHPSATGSPTWQQARSRSNKTTEEGSTRRRQRISLCAHTGRGKQSDREAANTSPSDPECSSAHLKPLLP